MEDIDAEEVVLDGPDESKQSLQGSGFEALVAALTDALATTSPSVWGAIPSHLGLLNNSVDESCSAESEDDYGPCLLGSRVPRPHTYRSCGLRWLRKLQLARRRVLSRRHCSVVAESLAKPACCTQAPFLTFEDWEEARLTCKAMELSLREPQG